MKDLTASALTVASEQPTKDSPINTKAWAEFLKFETRNDPELEALVEKCAKFGTALRDKQPPRWLSILGVTGTGKTHCATKLWKACEKKFNWLSEDFLQFPIYWPEFVSDLRSGIAFDRMRDMMQWPLLFLDDIGAERDTTGFASEQLNSLLGCRVDKWTILTSNLFLNQLGAIDPRISDRIVRAPNIFIELNTTSFSLR